MSRMFCIEDYLVELEAFLPVASLDTLTKEINSAMPYPTRVGFYRKV